MNTMTATKIVGAFCGTLLVFLLGAWLAESVYHVGGHYGEEQAYVIPVEGDEVVDEIVEEEAFDVVFASADPAGGERIWRQCSACHRLEDGANGTGPHLYGVVGRPAAAVGDYAYSAAFAELDYAWTPENLNGFLLDPSGWVPGTKMTYNGLDDVADRADIIAYMQGFGS